MKVKKKTSKAKQPKILLTLLVTIAPWYALILGVYGLLVGLTTVNISPFATAGGLPVGTTVVLSGYLLIVANLFLIFSFNKQLKRQRKGWGYFMIGQIINLLSAVVLVDFFRGAWDIVMIFILFKIGKFYRK